MGFAILIIFLLVVGFFIFAAIEGSNMVDQMNEKIKNLSDFEASQSIIGVGAMRGIAIDEKRGLFCLLTRVNKDVIPNIVPYSDIVSVEIAEDGSSVTKSSRGSQLGGAIVGGVLLGGVGAVVGGLSGKKKTTQKVSRVDLRVVIDNTSEPTYTLPLLAVEVDRGDITHSAAIDKARHWNGLFDIAMSRTEKSRVRDVNVVDKKKDAKAARSVADELKKLADLKADGVLTEDEFQTQKQRLLSGV